MPTIYVSTATRQQVSRMMDRYRTLICPKYELDPLLVKAICETESRDWPWAVRYEPGLRRQAWFRRACHKHHCDPDSWSSAISVGAMQVLAVNCYEQGFVGHWMGLLGEAPTTLSHGCEYIANLIRRYPNVEDALSAYNAGSPTPANRDSYVAPIMANWERLQIDDRTAQA